MTFPRRWPAWRSGAPTGAPCIRARADLDDALSIATPGHAAARGGLPHLEYARLCLADRRDGDGGAHLTRAKALVAETGYHRRDGEVAALEQETGGRGQWETGIRGQETGIK